jgi:UPF0176 protein
VNSHLPLFYNRAVSIQKVLLYYGFTPFSDPEAIRLWQRSLCEQFNLKGRILISKHGINGTVGGDMEDCKRYIKATKQYPGLNKIDFKWSDGDGTEFPRLRVRVRDELVAFGRPDELVVDENGVVGGGKHLKPAQVNKLVEERGEEVLFFDGRNAFEAKIGKFRDAIVPDTVTTRDFIDDIESGKYDHIKDRPIVTYCTGGIRCEILSTLMINRGFKEVYQIDGGIVRYGNKFGDEGLWDGSLYVFDNRMTVEFSDKAKTIGECEKCGASTKQFFNCANAYCHELILLCDDCKSVDSHYECTHDISRSHKTEMVG